MAGRPTLKTEETIRKIEEAAALDCSVEEMAFLANVHKDTIYSWLKEDEELSDRIEALRQRPVLLARKTVVKAIETDPNSAFRYLERKKKDEFSERKELTGKDGKDLQPVLVKFLDESNPSTSGIQKTI